MAYIPSGFWSRLMARMLSDDRLTACIERLFFFCEATESDVADEVKNVLNKEFRPDWLLWQTGFEVLYLSYTLPKFFG